MKISKKYDVTYFIYILLILLNLNFKNPHTGYKQFICLQKSAITSLQLKNIYININFYNLFIEQLDISLITL